MLGVFKGKPVAQACNLPYYELWAAVQQLGIYCTYYG